MGIILTCNAGSANTKLAAFDATSLERRGRAVARNDAAEFAEWLRSTWSRDVAVVGHRVVHGGREFTSPVAITETVLGKLKSCIPRAPLHQPAAIRLIEEVRKLHPETLQIACFDTAFHHTMPDIERRLPLPRRFHDEGVLRYGFHGLSCEHIADALPQIVGEELARGRVVVAHLGGGSSACAMKDRRSVVSTMGFSTLDGLMMATRCGALDAGVVLHLLTSAKMSVAQVTELLYHQSGLKGVSGISGDMRELLQSQSASAREAVELYCRLAARQIAGLLPSLGGLDALVFTGGIGENAAAVRERIVALLRFLGEFAVHVVPTDEELVMAQHCRKELERRFRAS